MSHLEPAKTILCKLGGAAIAADVTGKHISRVYRWMYPIERGGAGGSIPQRHIPKLLAYARQNNIALSADDFLASEAVE